MGQENGGDSGRYLPPVLELELELVLVLELVLLLL